MFNFDQIVFVLSKRTSTNVLKSLMHVCLNNNFECGKGVIKKFETFQVKISVLAVSMLSIYIVFAYASYVNLKSLYSRECLYKMK